MRKDIKLLKKEYNYKKKFIYICFLKFCINNKLDKNLSIIDLFIYFIYFKKM